MSNLCGGVLDPVWEKAGKHAEFYLVAWTGVRPEGVKRITMKCPKCKRKLKSSVELNHDGDYVIHRLPPHKPKGWWKRKKK
jgi:hypothetical protein